MKILSTAAAIALSALGAASAAQADTIMMQFRGMSSSTLTIQNNDTGQMLQCQMVGSGAGAVPTGCNWTIGFDPEDTRRNQALLNQGNGVCQIQCTGM